MIAHVTLDDRLSILRAGDRFRRWNSLDDQRICSVCERKFKGRQVEIRRFTGGRYTLHCSTLGCTSRPHQWLYPRAAVVSEMGWAGLVARRQTSGAPRGGVNATGTEASSMIGSTLDQPAVSSAPDEALMKAVSRQRYDALAELYDRHGKRLRATIDGVVHEEAEADDVLQEIFIQIWKEAGRYSPKAGKPLGWMVTIARRRAIDRLRRRQAYSRVRERYQERVIQQAPSSPREADDVFALNDLRHFLKRCMRVLPRLQREALELAFFKGLSHREIAAATHAPLGTVKTRLELGLQKLTHTLRPLRHKV